MAGRELSDAIVAWWLANARASMGLHSLGPVTSSIVCGWHARLQDSLRCFLLQCPPVGEVALRADAATRGASWPLVLYQA